MSFAQSGWVPSAEIPMEETTSFEKSQQQAYERILKRQETQRNEYEKTAKQSVNEMKKDYSYARGRWTGIMNPDSKWYSWATNQHRAQVHIPDNVKTVDKLQSEIDELNK